MSSSTMIGLVNNVALLLALGLLYETVGYKSQGGKPSIRQAVTGLVLGAIGIAVMLNPWPFVQGVVFDSRSVLLSVSGLFFGAIPTLIATLMTGVFRLCAGGAGVWTGVAVILTSGAIGVGWRHLRRPEFKEMSLSELYIMGLVVHVAMLLWMFSLPWSLALSILSRITVPVMVIYPLGTALLGWLMLNMGARQRAEEALKESEDRYRSFFENSKDAVLLTTPDGGILSANKAACEMFGRSEEELFRAGRGAVVDVSDPRLSAGLEQRSKTGLFKGDLTYLRKDGSPFIGETTSVVFGNQDGLLRTSIIIRDITERTQAEGALRKSEEEYRNLFENANEAIFVVQDGKLVFLNPMTAMMTGYSREELMTRPFIEFIHPDDRDMVFDRHVTRMKGKELPHVYSFRIIHKEANIIWGELNAVLINWNGKPATLNFLSDITERKQAEVELREKEQRYRELFDNMSSGVAVYEAVNNGDDFIFKDFNKAGEKIENIQKEDLIGKSVTSLFPGVKDFGLFDVFQRVWKTGKPEPFPITFYKDARISGWRDNYVYRLPSGEIVALYSDETERKKSEQALKESEARFRTAFENAAVGMVLVNLDGVYVEVNTAMARIIGYTQAELVGRPVASFTHPEDLERRMKFIDDLVAGRIASGEQERRFLHRNGSVVWALIWASVQRDSEGRFLYFISLVVDITERKKAEEEKKRLEAQLQHSQKMESVGRLAGGVAHDYNNILSVILGYTEMALDKVDPNDPLHADLKEILSAANRSIVITRQLLAFARRQTIAPKVLDLNDNVEGMLKMLRQLIGEDIDLAWLPGAGLWPVRVDPSQLDQILANLCVNARDAIAGVGKVTIETDKASFDAAYCADHPGFVPGEFALLAVSDNGCGMDKEVLDNLFEPFFTTKGVGQGTGLGLATVYGIVKQNDGFIDVYSEPGKGTTFRIYLPRHAGEAEEIRAEVAAEIPRGRGETVLLVEDEVSVLKLANRILVRLGYNVVVAGTPGEAMGLAKEHADNIQLLITDVVMPEMNGRDLAERLHALYPDIKTLFMSGYTANVIAHRGVLDKGVNFIQKPFSTKDLAAKVRAALDQ